MAVAAIDPEAELLNLWTEALRDIYHAKRPTIPEGLRELGYERWRAECDRLAESLGFTAAQADIDRLDTALWPIRAEIAKIPVASYAGLRVKALILAEQFGDDGVVDSAIADSVLADLGGRVDA
jgi:hypothetical protein